MVPEGERPSSGSIRITLKEYLKRLAAEEQGKPLAERRNVPTIVALARDVGIHPITMSNIANNHVSHFNLKTAASIIEAMRERGFPMDTADLFGYGDGASQ